MAYRVSQKKVMEMSKLELLVSFEDCIVSSVKEENFRGGTTPTTYRSYDLLRNRLLELLGEDTNEKE